MIKATGRGIDNELATIPCLDGKHHVELDILGAAKDWSVSSFEVDKGSIGSIAYSPLTQQVLFWKAEKTYIRRGFQAF